MPTGVPASRRLSFLATRNGARLGTHEVNFRPEGDRLTVGIAIDYAVKLGFITVFRYRLRATEIWEGGVLMSVRSQTDNNGKPAFMRADRLHGTLAVTGSNTQPYGAPAGTMLCSHWNRAQLDVPMINPQDGTLLRFVVSPKGPARVADAAGRIRPAERFGLAAKHALDLWYDQAGQWVALQGQAEDGSVVVYQPVA
jgi:hypothetical protein